MRAAASASAWSLPCWARKAICRNCLRCCKKTRAPAPRRDWVALEQMVLECKRLNARNSDLLTEQYSIMQRVLHGEEDTYAPG